MHGLNVPKIDPDGTGYPEVTAATIVEHGITDLFLSSEPHEFTVEEGKSLFNILATLTPTPPGSITSTAKTSPGWGRGRYRG